MAVNTNETKKIKNLNLIDLHVHDGEYVTLRKGWYMAIKGEKRFYRIMGIKPNGALSLQTYQTGKEGKAVQTAIHRGYQYNTQSFNYSAGMGLLVCQRKPFGELTAVKPKAAPPKAIEKPKASAPPVIEQKATKPIAKKPVNPAANDSILDLFGI